MSTVARFLLALALVLLLACLASLDHSPFLALLRWFALDLVLWAGGVVAGALSISKGPTT